MLPPHSPPRPPASHHTPTPSPSPAPMPSAPPTAAPAPQRQVCAALLAGHSHKLRSCSAGHQAQLAWALATLESMYGEVHLVGGIGLGWIGRCHRWLQAGRRGGRRKGRVCCSGGAGGCASSGCRLAMGGVSHVWPSAPACLPSLISHMCNVLVQVCCTVPIMYRNVP